MVREEKIKQREWGKSEITGPRHVFRINMMKRTIRADVPRGNNVLDAGCGDGSLTFAMLKEGYAVSAVDTSLPGLERLCKGLSSEATSLIVSAASLDALPFPEGSFDAVVSGEVLEHLDDDLAAAKEFFRVLKPGGVCIVTVPADPSLWSVEDEWAGHKRRYQAETLRALFEEAGFKIENLHHWGWPVIYLYDRFLFRAWIKRKLDKGDPDYDTEKSIGANPLLIKIMALAFSVDRIFQWVPKGIGLVGIFRKPA